MSVRDTWRDQEPEPWTQELEWIKPNNIALIDCFYCKLTFYMRLVHDITLSRAWAA